MRRSDVIKSYNHAKKFIDVNNITISLLLYRIIINKGTNLYIDKTYIPHSEWKEK